MAKNRETLYALFSADHKPGIEVPARALVAAGFTIISLGRTQEHLREYGIPSVSTEDFLADPQLSDRMTALRRVAQDARYKRAAERECREMCAGPLAQHLAHSPAYLRATGRTPIWVVCMNLMAAELVHDVDGVPVGVLDDKGGVTMLSAAKEGGRFTLTNRGQDERFISALPAGGGGPFVPEDYPELRLTHAVDTAAYLEGYARNSRVIGQEVVQASGASCTI